jgi:ribonuclease BN (tRNA processing enzyme)
MHVKILGTGTAVPSLRRLSSAYLLSTDSGRMLIDVGPSVVRRLLEAGHTVNEVDTIMLTHFHPDHTADLSTFLFASNYGGPERRAPLALAGGRGLRLFYRRLARLYPWILPNRYDLLIKVLKRNTWRVGNVSITCAPMSHREESIGIRVEEGGKSVVFSGDTGYTPALEDLAVNADLLVVECAFPERKMAGHLNLETLLPIIGRSNPKRVILSHLYPEWEEYDGSLPIPLLLGEDGMEIDLS